MTKNKRFLIFSMPTILALCSLFAIFDNANAASRVATRGTAMARKSMASTVATKSLQPPETITAETNEPEMISEPEIIVSNKSDQFRAALSEIITTANDDNSFAEQIRKQRNALSAREAENTTTNAQQNAINTNSSSCDIALRKCMTNACGDGFIKCATDGDTTFGDKLNKCRRDSECSGEEFSLFASEIKSDRDTNVELYSYSNVIDCGNAYNACIVNECGKTYNKCLGKQNADAAIQKCATIAKECTETDSGLTSRFGTMIGKLRENAEIEIKTDEERLYKLRDLMTQSCKSLGATFDERTFDCVYSVEFFAGENQSTPIASRKAYAGDTFVCTQEWFGINATTYQENAYRETRSQTGASSAMLGSGLGTAAGLISSGAIDRAIETQKAKKELKKAQTAEEKAQNTEEKKESNLIQKASEKTEQQTWDQAKKEANKDLQNTINKGKAQMDVATNKPINKELNLNAEEDINKLGLTNTRSVTQRGIDAVFDNGSRQKK